MVKQNLNKVFLSASIPSPERDKRFYDTADIIAIRDSVRALATVVIPKCNLVWGGHPSITPLIRCVIDKMGCNIKNHVTLYQSLFYENVFPEDNFAFENIVLTPKLETKTESLSLLRVTMLKDNDFKAGIFIGGMEGIDEEYKLFKEYNPEAIILPIASTGGASKILYEDGINKYNPRLNSDYAYMSMFKDLLKNLI